MKYPFTSVNAGAEHGFRLRGVAGRGRGGGDRNSPSGVLGGGCSPPCPPTGATPGCKPVGSKFSI